MNDPTEYSALPPKPIDSHSSEIITRPVDWMFLQPAMLDQMHDAVISTDLTGTIVGCNRAVVTTYGYQPEEIIGQSVTILYAEEDRHLLADEVIPAVLRDGSFRGEMRNRTRAGDHIYIHLIVALLRDADGHPSGMVGFSIDVTSQKLGELALRRSQEAEHELQQHKAATAGMEMLFAAVERAVDVIMLTEAEPIDEPGPRIVYVNQAFERMTGYSPAEVIGRTPRILQGPRSDRAALDRIRASLARWQPVREEIVNYRKDGSEFWVDLSIFPIANEKGWYTHWMAIQRDTSAQNAVRERLAEGESRHRFLTEAIPQLLWTADATGNCTFVSNTCAGFLGMPVTECLNGGWYSCVHPDDLAATEAKWLEAVRTGNQFVVEYRLRRHDGQFIWFLHRASPRKAEDGRVLEWIGTSTDIALQKRTEEALRQTEKLAAVGRLAASIAHEINNPLASVTNLLYLISHNASLDEDARSYVKTAEEELARVSEITTQTLRFHKQSTAASTTNLADVLASVLTLYRSRIEAGEIRIVPEFGTTRQITCFSGDLRQVFGNLVSNAIDALTRGGRLRIRLREGMRRGASVQAGLRVTIADNGRGIEEQNRARLFEPFFTTKGTTGTGLGLWVARDLVAKHGGTVRFRTSTRPGVSGTVMCVFLPFDYLR